ncbi:MULTISPECIES: type III secretion system inner membrane ring lipoprotein SctJ [Proteus]|uniref:type III secretion system inner membrane ring lipoprotein SctJ n=1 Tax=Proteus TaxID=583 RepID=UPI000D6DEB86|nr:MULTISPECIES: type III secretion inner membrane ring lipoprotein SctJ [Proteus]NBM78472.1 EscJ/YscJ/HrcJ family type III secretion inner membrane ring protein [Proteus sp. G2659]NBM89537.1 EscJ/YscJ/HrcJ family type III secretion inner membrane ring protein [Proteus sp. G2658]NBM92587.1 EscJ/YscJ/HrcJ family type III secretion inner membrane ring protein [Proteus sp. G2662]NBM97135.1 EscJ/YscJ/HrcJ family type III secretion inner membrane ring protein [Proteus sp. G2660]NBN03099.1 EscJ/YscJ
MKTRYLLSMLLFCLVSLLTGCKEQSLLTGLNQRQATQVQAVLQKHQITSTQTALGKGLFDVSVKKEDVAVAIQILEQYQLPSNTRVEITQIFPSDALVSSPQAEKARLISAIEQRLEQSLLTIESVIDARVHISYPISPSERIIPPPHASAIIFYEDSVPDAEQLGEDIRAFIHNSFNDMNEDNITVLLYPRNINKLNVLKPLTTDENSAITFNYWWLLGPLFIGLLFITIFIFIKYRQKKLMMKEKKDDILSSTV